MRATADEQISVFLANKPGVLADLCTALMERHISIRAMTVLDTVDIGTFRLLVDNVEVAKEVLREAGAAYVVVPVITLILPNKPGAVAKTARTLADAGINIEYLYATASQHSDRSLGVLRVSDQKRALTLDFDV